MGRKNGRGVVLLGAVIVLLAVLAAACGGGGGGGNTPTAGPTKAATTAATTAATPGGGTTIAIIGENSLFDKKELTAAPGRVTFEFDNRDAGVVHNLNIYRGKDATGESVGATELAAGPVKQTLTLELTAGEYYFQCDAHPTTMFGPLVVR